MKLYFVRHGQTESNKRGTTTGHVDSLLTEEGCEQARKTALEIPTDFLEIYSSDLTRCKDTASILNEKLGVPIFFDTRLRERHFGSLEGKTWIEIGDDVRARDVSQRYDYRPYGGESVEDVQKRLLSFIDDMKTNEEKKILVVTSAGIIRLLHHMINKETHERIHNSSLHEFDV